MSGYTGNDGKASSEADVYAALRVPCKLTDKLNPQATMMTWRLRAGVAGAATCLRESSMCWLSPSWWCWTRYGCSLLLHSSASSMWI